MGSPEGHDCFRATVAMPDKAKIKSLQMRCSILRPTGMFPSGAHDLLAKLPLLEAGPTVSHTFLITAESQEP